jgi:glycosyltransferase involved in cell wall biosynthesis
LEEQGERSRARNRGLRETLTPHVLFLDDDDLLPDDALRRHLSALERYPRAAVSIGNCRKFGGQRRFETGRLVRAAMLREIWPEVMLGWTAGTGQMMFRTRELNDAGGWGDSWPEDLELLLRLARTHPVALLPEIVLHYRVHPGQYRPSEAQRLTREVREREIGRLDGSERDRAQRLDDARRLRQTGLSSWRRAETWKALRLFVEAIRTAPELVTSPLIRRFTLVPMLSCLAGGAGLRAGRFLVERFGRRAASVGR